MRNGRFLAHQLRHHPLARGDRFGSVGRVLRWQVASRLVDATFVVPWVNGSKLVMERGMWGATGNYYFGLLDFREMGFVLHALREGDLFVDVGANVGVYSVLAASVGSEVLAFEPVPSTVSGLRRMIDFNDLDDRVQIVPAGVGAERGEVWMTIDRDTTNRVAISPASGAGVRSVRIVTLDGCVGDRCPQVIKIDVEGYELEVLRGARELLSCPDLAAVLVETAGHGAQYGVNDRMVHDFVTEYGFRTVSYDPVSRRLAERSSPTDDDNAIYVRDVAKMQATLASAPAFSLGLRRW